MAKKKYLYKIIDLIIFAAGLAVFVGKLSYLAYWQARVAYQYPNAGVFSSDMLAYMLKIMGEEAGYPFPYPIFFGVGKVFFHFMPIEYAVTVAEVLFFSLSVVIVKYYFDKEFIKENDGLIKRLVVTLSVFALFLLAMWWAPWENKYLPWKYKVYYGSFTGNPWHNATYIATRPFAIVSFASFVRLLKTYEDKIEKKDWLIFCSSLLLTTLTKPSFTFVLVSAAGLTLAFKVIYKKFSTIKNTLLFGVAFVPTFAVLFYQFFGVFGSAPDGGEHGVGFAWLKVWRVYTEYIPASIFYANVFAFACLIVFFRDIKKDQEYRFTLFLFVVGLFEACILVEKGYRWQDFNFAWGYIHCIFFLEMVSLKKLLTVTFSKKIKWYSALFAWGAFASQLIYGITYFIRLYGGTDYY